MTWTSAATVSRLSASAESDGRTPSGRILAHVPLLVAGEQSLGLDLGRGATGQLLVEAHDLLHADGVGRRADGLEKSASAYAVFIVGDRGSALLKSRCVCACGLETRRWRGPRASAYIGRGDLGTWLASGAIDSVSTDLGRDQGRETALLDEAHLVGCQSISTNCPAEVFFGTGDAPGWQDDGGDGVDGEVEVELRDSPDGAKPRDLRAPSTVDITVAHICNHATMSILPRTIASRALAPAFRVSSLRAAVPSRRAYATNESEPHQHKVTPEDAPAVKLTTDSTQIREEGASSGMRHQPDYNVAIDYRSSCVCSTIM